MTLDAIAEHLLLMPDAPYVDATYLVNGDGEVVLGSGGAVSAVPAPDRTPERLDELDEQKVELSPLPYPEIRDGIAANRRGHIEREGKVIVFGPISALGWWYVVVADEARLLR